MTLEPYADDRFRMEPRRPTSVVVIAILHLVIGGFGVLIGLCGGVTQIVGPVNFVPQMPAPPAGAKAPPFPTDMAPRMQRFLEAQIPNYTAIMLTQVGLGLVLSVMMLAAGIGLLSMRPWARKLSLIYGIGSLVYQLAGFVFTALVMLPIMGDFYKQMEQEFPVMAPVMALSRMGMWGGLVFALLGLVYPIVVLVLLTRRPVVAAFEGRPALPDMQSRDRPAERSGPSSGAFTR